MDLINMNPFGAVSVFPPKDFTVKPFAFVLNVSELTDGPGVDVAPGRTLRRATDKEIKFIKDMNASLFGHHFGAGIWETRPPKSSGGKYIKLPAKKWRYFVIEFSSDNENFQLLQETLAIAPY